MTKHQGMKIIPVLLCMLLAVACAGKKEMKFTGSTPAGSSVKIFLGIPPTDSIDFIRWNLALTENSYMLHCNYGIGKPNTNGFINGGITIDLSGTVKKVNNNYLLQNGKQQLKLAGLNTNLLHLLNDDNSLMKGNGGWSYTLNNLAPTITDDISIPAKQIFIKDSTAFEGRTPCGVPGVITPGTLCYKLKWLVFLYAGTKTEAGTFKLYGTSHRKQGGLRGDWKIITAANGRIIYQLKNEEEKITLNLLILDEGVLIFTDSNGNLLVGDLDFSYTLNKRF